MTDGGVALALFFPGTAEDNAFIQCDIFADLRGFADDDTHAVVDKETVRDPGAGMNFHPGEKAVDMADQPRETFKAADMKPMGQPVSPDGVETGTAEKHHQPRSGGRVPLHNGVNIPFYSAEHNQFPPKHIKKPVCSETTYRPWFHSDHGIGRAIPHSKPLTPVTRFTLLKFRMNSSGAHFAQKLHQNRSQPMTVSL